jgi:hypothetical protein
LWHTKACSGEVETGSPIRTCATQESTAVPARAVIGCDSKRPETAVAASARHSYRRVDAAASAPLSRLRNRPTARRRPGGMRADAGPSCSPAGRPPSSEHSCPHADRSRSADRPSRRPAKRGASRRQACGRTGGSTTVKPGGRKSLAAPDDAT